MLSQTHNIIQNKKMFNNKKPIENPYLKKRSMSHFTPTPRGNSNKSKIYKTDANIRDTNDTLISRHHINIDDRNHIRKPISTNPTLHKDLVLKI